jgi:methyl-accepting chemotaxis protein
MARDGEKNSQNEIVFVQKELTKMKDAEGDRLSSITLTDKKGIVFASSESGKMRGLDLSGRDYIDKAFKGIANVGSVVVSRATGRVICTAAGPIYASTGKDITGAVVIAMELKYLTDIIDKIKIGKTGFAYIVDKNGLYITHPVKENILKVNISQVKGMEAIAKLTGQNKVGIEEYELDGILRVATIVPEPITGALPFP